MMLRISEEKAGGWWQEEGVAGKAPCALDLLSCRAAIFLFYDAAVVLVSPSDFV